MNGLDEMPTALQLENMRQKMRVRGVDVSAAGLRVVERLFFAEVDGVNRSSSSEEGNAERESSDGVASVSDQIALLSLQKAQAEAAAELEAARKEARTAAMRELKRDLEEKVAEERATVSHLCEQFSAEKQKYFAAVEGEVVKLSLAIAKRVLQREVLMDPTLLRGVVRVALENIAEGSTTVLRVPMDDEEAWVIAMKNNRGSQVSIIGDAGMGRGECALEAEAGRMELGVAAQLQEIERGFFDLLELRPV